MTYMGISTSWLDETGPAATGDARTLAIILFILFIALLARS